MKLKHELIHQCKEYINNRLEIVQKSIEETKEALNAETKSTAGDKHETGRAMIQLEREKLGFQLKEIQKSQNILNRVNPNETKEIVSFGSIVKTSDKNYFIAISAGEIKIESEIYPDLSAYLHSQKFIIDNQQIIHKIM